MVNPMRKNLPASLLCQRFKMGALMGVIVIAAAFSILLPSPVFSSPRFEKGPAEVWLATNNTQSDGWMPSIPRGAMVECCVGISAEDFESNRFKEARVEVDGRDRTLQVLGQVEITQKVRPDKWPDRYERISNRKRYKVPALKFTLYVSVKAKLGPRTLRITGSDGFSLVLNNALRVCNPLVVIVDMDGMRRDVFYNAIDDPNSGCPNIRRLTGPPVRKGGYLKGLSWLEYQNGIGVNEAVTVFPTVTFAGHAAIVSGSDPAQFNMAGNEWFDRDKVELFAFTGSNTGVLGKGPGGPFNSFFFGMANDRLLESGVKTVFQEAHEGHQGVTSYVGHLMYYGDTEKKAAFWDNMTIEDQVRYIPTSTTHETDQGMALTAGLFIWLRETPPKPPRLMPHPTDPFDKPEGPQPEFTGDEYDRLGIILLYFAGLDHFSHEAETPREVEGPGGKQATFLKDNIDGSLGIFLNNLSDVAYKNTTFILTADHGHTTMKKRRGEAGAEYACFSKARTKKNFHKFQDLLWECGYLPNGANINYAVYTSDIYLENTSAVVGLNGGLAHIYLRRLKESAQALGWRDNDTTYLISPKVNLLMFPTQHREWNLPPTYDEVIRVARWFHENLQDPIDREADPYNKSLDMILVRDVKWAEGPPTAVFPDGRPTMGDLFSGSYSAAVVPTWEPVWESDYRVYLGPWDETATLEEYFKSPKGVEFLKRNGWNTERDALLVIDRIRRLQGKMSGDLILIPRYPDFYCEYKPLYGDHGSLQRSDFEVPFVLARAGADGHDMAFLRDVLEKGIQLDTKINWEKGMKNRPSTTDIKNVVLRLLQPKERRFDEEARIEVRKSKLTRGKNINNTYK